jgi:NAD-dependent dihydropyrimidine dehydrogenase PreA subunit
MNERFGPPNSEAQPPVGAVLVVGGGIAGMQASLDLADQGFKVYLVETETAIGGHMAQLDKTFPTNDCAMCNISPKLVDTGRHLDIEILTGTEVLSISGEVGNFTARVLRKPRYVDVNKCIGCGECIPVCPVTIIDPYEEGLKSRKAIYRRYSQAVPAAFAIEKLGTAPCRSGCPVGQRAQGYIALIAQGLYREALRVIKEDNPFPSVCGRTCHHPCEGKCTRALVDEAVSIMSLKRFVVDYALAYGRERVQPAARTYPGWVAVVGAGPAGLTAAHDLVKMGYGVTVYEALSVPGGMMRVGIPAHRLPKGELQRDIDDILALGVVLKTNSPIEDPGKAAGTRLQRGMPGDGHFISKLYRWELRESRPKGYCWRQNSCERSTWVNLYKLGIMWRWWAGVSQLWMRLR